MNEFKIPFAYHNGQCIDVSTAQKGITYQCTCGADVKLRGGEKVRNHFYHVNNETCSYESIIHKAYKEVFYKLKQIRLPYTINGYDVLKFDRVELEKKLYDFIPDAIGYIGDDIYIIEFAKTSFIGERKLIKIKNANVMCIEIRIINCESLNDISKHLLSNNHREILHIPDYIEMTILRERFVKAYREKENELMKLKNKLQQYESLQELNNTNYIRIPFKKKLSNGSDMYKVQGNYGELTANVHERQYIEFVFIN